MFAFIAFLTGVAAVPLFNSTPGFIQLSLVADDGVPEYNLQYQIGTPGQPMIGLLDTGSSDLWVYASNGTNVPAGLETFDPARSSTFKFLNSTLNVTYLGNQHAEGDLVSETLTVGGYAVKNDIIGLAYSGTSTQLFFGLGYPFLEQTNIEPQSFAPFIYETFLESLQRQGLINRKAFSVYLNDVGVSEGTLVLGGIDHAKIDGDLTFVPTLLTNDFDVDPASLDGPIEYSIQINGLRVFNPNATNTSLINTTVLDSGYMGLLDTGNPELGLPTFLFNQVINALGAIFDPSVGVPVLDCELAQFSVITVELEGGYELEINVGQTALPVGDPFPGLCELIIFPFEDSTIALGAVAMRDAYVVFDQDANEIGFAKAKFGALGTSRISSFASLTTTSQVTATVTNQQPVPSTFPSIIRTVLPQPQSSSVLTASLTETLSQDCQASQSETQTQTQPRSSEALTSRAQPSETLVSRPRPSVVSFSSPSTQPLSSLPAQTVTPTTTVKLTTTKTVFVTAQAQTVTKTVFECDS